MYPLTYVYTVTLKSQGSVKFRHLTVGLFGIIMIILLAGDMSINAEIMTVLPETRDIQA